eukprot:SAG11_NODE_7504_length_1136_cov_1.581485_1_plen_211_part_01
MGNLENRSIEDIEWFARGFILLCERASAVKLETDQEQKEPNDGSDAKAGASNSAAGPAADAAASATNADRDQSEWAVVRLCKSKLGPHETHEDSATSSSEGRTSAAVSSDLDVGRDADASDQLSADERASSQVSISRAQPAFETEDCLLDIGFVEYLQRNGKSYLQRLEHLIHLPTVLQELTGCPELLSTLANATLPAPWWNAPSDDIDLL